MCIAAHGLIVQTIQNCSLLKVASTIATVVFQMFEVALLGEQWKEKKCLYRYVNTAACISRISFIDGDKGILRYRGYPIEELAERSSYTEVAPFLCPSNKQFDLIRAEAL